MSQENAAEQAPNTTRFTGEEGGDERSTPRKDLGAAVVIGALAIFFMALSLGLEVPTTVFTAPGLLPFLTGLSLLAMAIGLGVGALRRGGADGFAGAVRSATRHYFGETENRRTLILMGVLFAYVLVTGHIDFDLRMPVGPVVVRFSSWEAISIPVLAWILRFFWRGAWWRCGLYSAVMVFALAGVFRYAFHILLPAG